MLEQVRCTSSWWTRIHRRRWREVVRVRVPPTVPDRGNDTAETTRDRENSIGFAARARVCCFVPFSAVSVACFDSNSHELAFRRLVPSSAQQVGRGGVSGRINSPHGPTLRTRQAGSWNVAEERWKRDSWSIFAR